MKSNYEGWHQDIKMVIDLADKNECFRWALYNRPVVKNWSTSRATILGDAAHATQPYLAQGAAMAIEDGAVLARCLKDVSDTSKALNL